MNVVVRFRKTDKDQHGLRNQTLRASTCDDLIKLAKSKLQPTWSQFGFSEEPTLVVLEAESGGTNTIALKKQPEDPVQTGKVYTVLECWTKTPVPLLRRVRLDDVNKNTYTHPDKRSNLTQVSPLACAAVRPNEAQIPCFSTLSDGSIDVHGISLGLNNDATPLPAAVDPLAPITLGSNEDIGIASMSLNQYKSLIPIGENKHPRLGILRTSISHGKVFVRAASSQGKQSFPNKPAGQVTKRMVNWRFALQEGFDLAEHGMMLVWDNRHFGHCCLVRLKETVEMREWRVERNKPCLPMEAVTACQNVPGSFNDVLRNVAFVCVPDKEPEPLFEVPSIGGQDGIAFPKLASHFTLFDIRMEATAEPQPIKDFRNDPKTKLYRAVVVLYYVNADSWIQHSIHDVVKVDYEVEKLSIGECSRLVEAFDLASVELDDETTEDKEKQENLAGGRDVLSEFLSSSLSNAPPAAPAPLREAPSQGGVS